MAGIFEEAGKQLGTQALKKAAELGKQTVQEARARNISLGDAAKLKASETLHEARESAEQTWAQARATTDRASQFARRHKIQSALLGVALALTIGALLMVGFTAQQEDD